MENRFLTGELLSETANKPHVPPVARKSLERLSESDLQLLRMYAEGKKVSEISRFFKSDKFLMHLRMKKALYKFKKALLNSNKITEDFSLSRKNVLSIMQLGEMNFILDSCAEGINSFNSKIKSWEAVINSKIQEP